MFSVVSGENQEWWELFKKASVSICSLSGKISAETALFQRWFFCSENLVFQRCFRENQLCFRENQRWNSSDSALIFLLWKFPVSELFQRKSALFSSESALFQSWISAVQRFSGNEQRWNRPESILNQSWSALNVSETSTRVNNDVT